MRSRIIWTLAVVVVLSILAVFTYRRRENPPPRIRDLSGGARIQRQRIDRAINTASAVSVDEAIASLSEYNESYELAALAGESPAIKGTLYINRMLGDRRISKIFEHLSSLPATKANAKAQQIFDDHLATLQKEWRNLAKNGGLPRTGPPHHAVSAGLFLCSFFSSRETLDSKIQHWHDALIRPEFEKIPYPSRLIDPLFHLNLLVISGHKHGRSVSQLNKELESLCQKIFRDEKPFLQVTQMRMFKYSAETLATDFTHRTRGVPASGNSVLLELPGFADPASPRRFQKVDVADQFLNCIRTWRDR